MRILVAGIGGVGGYLGAKLCTLDDEIIFLTRGESVQKILKDGLRVDEDDVSYTVHPSSVTTAKSLEGVVDLLFLCVKSYDIRETLLSIESNISKETIIVPFSNGVAHQEEIEAIVDAKVLHGAMYILAHKEGIGHIVKKGAVFMALFGHKNYPEERDIVAKIFEDAGLRYKSGEHIESLIWKKYLFISTFGALTSYFDTTMRAVYELHKNWAHTMMMEIAAVAEAKGIALSSEVEKSLESASKVPLDASSSMHLDFQNSRETELETLCGYIVKEGVRLRVPTPLMAKVYEVLKEKH